MARAGSVHPLSLHHLPASSNAMQLPNTELSNMHTVQHSTDCYECTQYTRQCPLFTLVCRAEHTANVQIAITVINANLCVEQYVIGGVGEYHESALWHRVSVHSVEQYVVGGVETLDVPTAAAAMHPTISFPSSCSS